MRAIATLRARLRSWKLSNTRSSARVSEASVAAQLDLLRRLTVAVEHLVSRFDALTSDLEKYAIWIARQR